MKTENDKNKLLERLKASGIVQIACQQSRISRATYYRWRKEDLDFEIASEKALEQGRDIVNDLAESKIIGLIKNGSMQAIKFWLGHNHKKYIIATKRLEEYRNILQKKEEEKRRPIKIMDDYIDLENELAGIKDLKSKTGKEATEILEKVYRLVHMLD